MKRLSYFERLDLRLTPAGKALLALAVGAGSFALTVLACVLFA